MELPVFPWSCLIPFPGIHNSGQIHPGEPERPEHHAACRLPLQPRERGAALPQTRGQGERAFPQRIPGDRSRGSFQGINHSRGSFQGIIPGTKPLLTKLRERPRIFLRAGVTTEHPRGKRGGRKGMKEQGPAFFREYLGIFSLPCPAAQPQLGASGELGYRGRDWGLRLQQPRRHLQLLPRPAGTAQEGLHPSDPLPCA